MPASTSQRRTKPKVRRNSDVIDLADGTRYEQATTYQTLLDEVKALQ